MKRKHSLLSSPKRAFAGAALVLFITEIVASFIVQIPTASAQEVSKGKHTFKVSAYYSPLPGQKNYLRGTYEAEIKLNGEGVRGASGVGVHPGMIAAPKTYPFGTKIILNGLGVGTVEDRGGAIVSSGVDGQSYDRLDVWMGFGDEGLQRALNWGMRVVDGEILGSTNDEDSIDFLGLQTSLNKKPTSSPQELTKEEALKLQEELKEVTYHDELLNSFPVNVGLGSEGEHVKLIQASFKKLGYFKGEIDGNYDQDTVNAVFTFQIAKKLVNSEEDTSAGYFGLKTRMMLVDILINKKITTDELQTAILSDAKKQKEEQKNKPLILSFSGISQMEVPLVQSKVQKSIPILAMSSISTMPFIAHEKSATLLSNTVDMRLPSLNIDQVENMQAKLLLMGYNPGPVTGKVTAKMKIAIRQFERDNHLPVTGKLSQENIQFVHKQFLTKPFLISKEVKGSKISYSLQKYFEKKGVSTTGYENVFSASFIQKAKSVL